jgi:hypothetical protein
MRTPILVITLFIVGVALGLGYAWLINPVTFSQSSPAQVMNSYRDEWLLMTAQAYARDGDWSRAQVRLNALHDTRLAQSVAAVFERVNTAGPNANARAAAQLADRLGVHTPEMQVYLAGLAEPTRTALATRSIGTPRPGETPRPSGAAATPTDTPAPRPTETPSPTPLPPYEVIDRQAECAAGERPPQIRVFVHGLDGAPQPGKEVWITWEGGSDRLVTGLKPEIDLGYGDFDMRPDQSYNIGIDKPTSVIVSGLRAEPCGEDGRTSWRLVFAPRPVD